MNRYTAMIVSTVSLACLVGAAHAGEGRDDWHGSGWLGTAWGRTEWGYGFRRDPVIGAYGARSVEFDAYAPYRNDNGCYRMLPVETSRGVRLRRVFVCDF